MEANYTIHTSYFGSFTKISEDQLTLRRGVALYLNASNSTTCLFLLETILSNNHAQSGAGMLIEHFGSNHVVRVCLHDSNFSSNRALREGGGISVHIHSNKSNFSLHLNNCTELEDSEKQTDSLLQKQNRVLGQPLYKGQIPCFQACLIQRLLICSLPL